MRNVGERPSCVGMLLMASRRKTITLGLPAALSLLAVFCAWHFHSSGEKAVLPMHQADPSGQASANAQQTHASARSMPEKAFRVAADGMVDIPDRFQLPGVARARSGASLKEWLLQYPPDQQAKMLDFNKKHFGVYMVNSPEQVAWMAQNGYPLPEDVVAAESLTVDDLRELAKRGNDKAAFLLRERNIETTKRKVDDYISQGKAATDFWTADPEGIRLLKDEKLTKDIASQSDSPYRGFLQTQEALLLSEQVGIDSTVIAGLSLARRLGDFRAGQFLSEYTADNPIREAMEVAANAVAQNDSMDIGLMQSRGCPRVGVPLGMSIPGAFAPVD